MLLPSPDLMIAARSTERLDAGDFELILAELHDDCSTVFGGFFACFHPDPEGIRAIFEDRIRSQNNWEMLGSVLGGRRSKHVTPELPGTTILLSGLSGRAATEPQVPIADVEIVEADDGHLVLRAGGRPIILYPGDLSSVVHEAFALPRVVPLDWLAIAGGTSIPRVSANGIVVQRATWDVDAAVFQLQAKGELGCAEFHELRQRIAALGIPEWFFIRWAKHEKPVLIDTRNPWALDLLRRIASQAVRVRAAEMYPDPGNIFWSSEQGHHTFELRTALLRENNDEQVRQGVLQ
jgi:hypothetical protein